MKLLYSHLDLIENFYLQDVATINFSTRSKLLPTATSSCQTMTSNVKPNKYPGVTPVNYESLESLIGHTSSTPTINYCGYTSSCKIN